jgi:hypothetical protein
MHPPRSVAKPPIRGPTNDRQEVGVTASATLLSGVSGTSIVGADQTFATHGGKGSTRF